MSIDNSPRTRVSRLIHLRHLARRSKITLSIAALFAASLTPNTSLAATYWWDGVNVGGTGDGASAGGTATWDTTTLNWDQGNGLARVAWPGVGNTAIFGGPAGPYTVTLGAPISVDALSFTTTGYTLSGANTLALAGVGNNISVGSGMTTTINSVIDGTNGLGLIGGGTLLLGGAANTFSGGVRVANNSTLSLDFSAAGSPTTNIVNASNALTLNYGSLVLTGKSGLFDNAQTFAGTTLSGGNTITLTPNGANSLTASLGALTRNSGSTLALNLSAGTFVNATAPGVDTLYGNVIVNGSDFALHQTGGNIVANTTYTINNAANTWTTSTDNITNDAAYTGATAAGNTTINSLRYNFGGASTFTVGSAATSSLTISSGGILLTPNSTGAQVINAGATNALTGPYITTANATTDLTITNNSAGSLTINPNIGVATGGIAPQAVVKTGTGAVVIGNASMIYSTNGLFVNQGTLSVGTNVTLSAATFNNSTYALRNPLGTTAAGVATPVTLGAGTTLNVNWGTPANLTSTFNNEIRVPQGSANLVGTTSAAGAATNLLVLGRVTLGDGASLTTTAATNTRYQFAGLTVEGGLPGQPTSASLVFSNTFNTISGSLVGTSGGTTLNFTGAGDYVLNTGTAPSNITQINRPNGRLYVNNITGLGTIPVTLGATSTIISDQNAANNYTQLITVASGGGLANRQNSVTYQAAGLPASGTLVLNNDNSATSTMTLAGTYPQLASGIGNYTFQIGGDRNTTAGNAIGATTITNGLDASVAGTAGTFTLNANYLPVTASTTTPAATNLLTINSLALGANNLVVSGTGTGSNSASITIGNITTTGPGTNSITKNGQGSSILTLSGTTSNFSGGVTSNVGGIGIGANSTVAGGVITAGPLGTGNLSLTSTGQTLRDNGGNRTIHNNVAITGNATFDTAGTAMTNATNAISYTNRLTLEDAGLTTSSVLSLNATTNPTYTVNNITTWSQATTLSGGATGFTKAGSGLLLIDAPVTGVNAITVTGGNLQLTPNAAGVGALNTITVNTPAAYSAPGTQASLNAVTAASTGTYLITADSSDNLNFAVPNNYAALRLGAAAQGIVYRGTITPNTTNNTILLGGGGTLYVAGNQTSGSIDVGLNGLTSGDVFLLGNNTHTGTTISGASTAGSALVIKADSALGNTAGGLTFASAAVTPRLVLNGAVTVPNTRAFTISGSTSNTIDSGVNNQILNNTWAGTGALVFSGRGGIALSNATSTGTVTINNTSFTAAGAPIGVSTSAVGTPFGAAAFTIDGNVAFSTGGAVTTTVGGTGNVSFQAGTVSLGAAGTPGATLTLGGTVVRTARGALVLAPANGTANMGTAAGETYKQGTAPVAGTGGFRFANGVVSDVFGRDANAAGTGTFLNYTANGYVPATYTTFGAGNIDASTATSVADVTAAVASQSTNATAYALRTNSNIAINTANTLTVGAGGLVLNGTGTTISGGVATGGLVFTGETSIYTSGTATISAIIPNTNSPTLNIVGPGVLTLQGGQLFQSAINIRGGTLATAGFTDSTTAATPLGVGNRIIIIDGGGTYRLTGGALDLVASAKNFSLGAGGGSLDINNGGVLTFNDGGQWTTTAGTGTLYVTNSSTGSGTAIFSNQTYAMNGPVVIGSNTGSITFRYGANQNTNLTSTLGNGLASAFTVQAGGNLDIGTATAVTRTIVLQGGSLLSSNAPGATLNGSLLVQTGGGTINNANQVTANGEVFLEGGSLVLSGAGAKNFNAPIVGSGTTPDMIANSGTYSVYVTGAWTPNTTNTYTNGTSINTGGNLTLTSDSQLSLPGTPLAVNGGTLTAGGNVAISAARNIYVGDTATAGAGVSGIFATGANTLTINGVIANQGSGVGNVTKTGTGTLNLAGLNTYTGVTDIVGIVNVSNFSDYGVAGGLGARTSAQETLTGNGIGIHIQSGGTLQYTGSTPQSTNRQIRIINGTTPTIDASGSVPGATLSFTYNGANTNLFDTAGTRTLNLTGSNTGNNIFAIRLENQSTNATSLTKSGTGTWVLAAADGTSTNSGTTTIQNGILKIANNNAMSTAASLAFGSTTPTSGTFDLNGFNQQATTVSVVGGTANQIINSGTGTPILTLTGGSTIAAANLLGGTGSNNNFTLNKTTASTLTISAAQTFTGGTTITGTGNTNLIDLRNPAGLGGTVSTYRNVSLAGGALNMRNDTDNIDYFINLSVDASGASSNAANLRIGNIAASTLNPLRINVGTITFNGANTLGMDEVGMTSPGSYQLGTTGVVLNGNGVFDLGAGAATTSFGRLVINGPISETGGSRDLAFTMAKTGDTAFRATLTAAGTYTGNTTIGQAVVFAQNQAAFGTGVGKTITLNNGASVLETQIDTDATFAQGVTIAGNNAIRVGRLTNGAGSNATFGPLSMGAFTLTTGAGLNSGGQGAVPDVDTPYSLTFGTTTLTGNANFTVNNNGTGVGTLNLSNIGETGGARSLTKAGAGTLVINGTSTYTGGTVVNGANGTLRAGSATAFNNNGSLTMTAGTLDLNGNNAAFTTMAAGAAAGIITDNAAGAGTSILSLTNQATNTTVASLFNDGATRKLAINLTNANANFRILESSANTFSGGLTLLTSASGSRLVMGAAITGTPYGTGPITVGQASTDKAGILVGAALGTLTNDLVFNTELGTDRFGFRFDNSATIAGQVTANSNLVLSSNATTGAPTFTGKITGAGGLVLDVSQTGTANTVLNVTLNNATANPNDYSGDTIVGRTNAAPGQNYTTTLTLGAADQIPNGAGKGNVILNNNTASRTGNLNLAGFSETINGLSGNGTLDGATGTPTLTLGDGNATGQIFSGVIKNTTGILSVTKIGTGTQTFSGANTYSGPTTVNNGTLAFSASNSLGDNSVGNLINVNGGTLSYSGSTAVVMGANQTVSIGASGATFDAANLNGTVTFAGASGTGNLTKTGPGTVVLAGTTNLGTGGVSVASGTLRAGFGTNGVSTINVASGANLSFQNSAIEALTLNGSPGSLTLAAGSRLGFEFNGALNDKISAGALGTTLTSAGNITLDLFNFGAGIQVGMYDLLTASGGLNAATYVVGAAPSGFSYTLTQSDTLVQLNVSQVLSQYWRGGQNASWATLGTGSANWTDDLAGTVDSAAVPGPTSKVVFSSTAAPFTSGSVISTTLDAAFTINDLQFTANPAGITGVTIAAGTNGTLTIAPGGPSDGIKVDANAGVVTIAAPLTTGTAQTWDVNGTGANGSSLVLTGNTTFTSAMTKTGAGALTLNGTNTGAGTITLTGGTLNINSATALGNGNLVINNGTTIDNNSGSAVTLANNNTQTWNGAFTYTGTNSLSFGTGAVTLNTASTVTTSAGTLTVGAVNSSFALTKAGAGTLLTAGNLNLNSTLSVSAGTMTLNGVTNTINGAVTIGSADISATMTLGTNTSFQMNAPASNFVIGNRTTANANIVNDTFNGSAASNVSINASVLQLGTQGVAPENTNATNPLVTFTLPTGAASTSTISAASSIQIGMGENSGVNSPNFAAVFNLGGGSNTITTPLIAIGQFKTGALFGFQTGSAGSLNLSETGGDGKTDLVIGNNPSTGTTGTNPASLVNLTTTGTVTAALGTITLARSNSNSTAMQTGTFTLAASGVGTAVTADNVAFGSSTSGTLASTTGTFNLSAGTFTINSATGTGFTAGSGTVTNRTQVINVSGTGLLDLSNKPINSVASGTGTSSLNLTGGEIRNASTIGNFTNLTFTDGILRNIGTISRSLNQNGANTLLDVGNNIGVGITATDMTIAGDYTVTGSTGNTAVQIATGRTLNVNGAMTVNAGNVAGPGSIGGTGVSYTFANTGASRVSATLTGPTATFAQSGAGTTTLTRTNTYGGATTITGGTLQLGDGTSGNDGTISNSTNIVNDGSLVYNRFGTASYGGVISGAGSVTKLGAGTQALTAVNTYTGTTTVSAGKLSISGTGSINNSSNVTINGGNLNYSSSTALTAPVTFTAGTLSGTNWGGSLANQTIDAGKTISPGNSPGTATSVTQVWAGGGTYQWELNSVSGTKGNDPGWDWLNLSGALTQTATSANKFTIDITGLNLGNTSGAVNGWNPALSSSYVIATAAGGITGFDASGFTLNTTNFVSGGNSSPGNWSIFQSGNDIVLGYTVTGSGNNSQLYVGATAPTTSLQTTTVTQAFGRVMQGSLQSATVTLNKIGGDTTTATVAVTGDALTATSSPQNFVAGPTTLGVNAGLNTSTTGVKTGSIIIDNQATTSSATSLGSDNGNALINVTGTVLAQRTVTGPGSTLVGNFLRNGTGIVSANINITSTTGDNDSRTQVNVAGTATADANGISITGSSSVFNGSSPSTSRTISGTFVGSNVNGTVSGSRNLAVTTAEAGSVGDTVPYPAIVVGYTVNVGNASFNSSDSSVTYGTALTALTPSGTFTDLSSTTTANTQGMSAPIRALGTTATILNYTNSTAGDSGIVSMAWRSRTANEAALNSVLSGENGNKYNGFLISDVVNITGMTDSVVMGPNGYNVNKTDNFVLQMTYNEALLLGHESGGVNHGNIYIVSRDINGNWINAVSDNIGGTPNYLGISTPTNNLGDYGIMPGSDTVWAVLNHNSEFAVIPEPSTLVLGGLAIMGFIGVGLRRRRWQAHGRNATQNQQ